MYVRIHNPMSTKHSGSLVSFSTQVSRGPRSGTRPATAQSSPQVWQRPGSCASMCPPSIFSHSPICQFSDWHPRKMFFRPRTYPVSLRGQEPPPPLISDPPLGWEMGWCLFWSFVKFSGLSCRPCQGTHPLSTLQLLSPQVELACSEPFCPTSCLGSSFCHLSVN